MPNIVKFREDPDAMLVMALEEYDEVTGRAAKAPILLRDVVGPTPARHARRDRRGRAAGQRSTERAASTWPTSRKLYGKPEDAVVAELGDLIYRDPESGAGKPPISIFPAMSATNWPRPRTPARPIPAMPRPLRAVQPEDVLPGDIDANLGAPWIPAADIQAFAAESVRRRPVRRHDRPPEEGRRWSVEAGHAAEASVAATAEYGTRRANGAWLLEQALNLKTPVIYDTVQGVEREERVVNQEATLAAREKQKLIKETIQILGVRRARAHRAAGASL